MARKSRKNLPQPEQAVISVQFPELDEGKIPTAIYGRLSVEDNEDNESMETQIALVQDFINRSSELNYVDEGGRIVVQFKYEQSIQDAVRALHTD